MQIAGLALLVVWILAVTGVALLGKNVAPDGAGSGRSSVPAERQEEPVRPPPAPVTPPVVVTPTDIPGLPCAPYCDPGK